MTNRKTIRHGDAIIDIRFSKDGMNVSIWTENCNGGYIYHGEHDFILPQKTDNRVIPALVNR